MENKFVSFLMSLAQEGETILLVNQKPILKDGQVQRYKDGKIRCTYPAFLPSAYTGKGSWYGNTGCFSIKSMGLRISASIVHSSHCIVLMLDDVGTKSKVPPLKPTWIIETSPGNFQYGYVFSFQPTTAEFSAAVKAIANAGYTDPGAINPVRNFRLPGSFNIAKNFTAVLTEFNPEIQYELSEICSALGVVPEAPDTAILRVLKVQDNGGDDVLEWIAEEGYLLERVNSAGWAGVICPNAAEHSDGNPQGRYSPLTRGFKCMHGHCEDWKSVEFLAWVASEGGPKKEHGLREELLVSAMTNALAKITPGDVFRDDGAQAIIDADRRELGRVEMSAWWARFAYVLSDEAYFDIYTRREVSRTTFNALYRHINCRSINSGRKVEASICFDEGRQAQNASTVVGITYAAGEDVIVLRDGELYGNRWCNARPVATTGDVDLWLAHCQNLIPNASEREHCWDAMAFKVQHPEIKINHAILHGGFEGCGKDTMWAPFIWAVCGSNLKNRGIMDNDTISSQWGYQLESEILLINELREPDAAQRRAFANKLKPIIAAPPEMLPINRKGLHPYMMLNRIFVLAFSNDTSPISLASQDRRWFCIWSHCPRMSVQDANAMWKWYKSGGFNAIAAWLQARNVAQFNPAAPAPMTDFKQNLIEHGLSTAEAVLVDMMKERRGEFAAGVIGAPFHTICSKVVVAMPVGTKVPQAALFHALQEAGWKDMGRLTATGLTAPKHIFCAPDLAYLSKSDLRRMVEKPTLTDKVVAIKKAPQAGG